MFRVHLPCRIHSTTCRLRSARAAVTWQRTTWRDSNLTPGTSFRSLLSRDEETGLEVRPLRSRHREEYRRGRTSTWSEWIENKNFKLLQKSFWCIEKLAVSYWPIKKVGSLFYLIKYDARLVPTLGSREHYNMDHSRSWVQNATIEHLLQLFNLSWTYLTF